MSEGIQNDEGLNIKTLFALGYEWIKLDDLIEWLKLNKDESNSETIHLLLKAVIKLKNQK